MTVPRYSEPALATHWLADEGQAVPRTHGEVFAALADRGVIDRELADRMKAAAGLRNLIAHQYGVIDFRRIFEIASTDVQALLACCQQLAVRAGVDS